MLTELKPWRIPHERNSHPRRILLVVCMRLSGKQIPRQNTFTYCNTALAYIEEKVFPRREEVRAWFPKPFAFLEKDGTPCSLESMQEFWRVTHCDLSQESPVYPAQVKTVGIIEDNPNLVQAHNLSVYVQGSHLLVASNTHQYYLRYNDIVLIHGFVVAEVLSK
jgi:hypothetical protein